MGQIEVVGWCGITQGGASSCGIAHCHPESWHRRLKRGRGASSLAGVTGRGNIALFLDSGIWQGLEGCPKGAFIFTTPHAKIPSSMSTMTRLL